MCYTKSPTVQDMFKPIPSLITCTAWKDWEIEAVTSWKKGSQVPSLVPGIEKECVVHTDALLAN